MRFVLVSTHIDQTTGYSKVAYELLRQLATLSPSVKTYHFGFQRHPARGNLRKYPDGVLRYDAAANEDPKEEGFGFNKIHEYLEMVNPDVVLIYNDPLVINKFVESMKHERGKSPYKLWIYLDQVYDGIAMPLIQKINEHVDRVYCFTEEWKTKYLRYESFPDVRVLEHAIDAAIFTNMSSDQRKTIRKNLSIPDDAIVFMNANRNSERKRLDLTIAGFVELLRRRPLEKLYLLLATNINPQMGSYYDVQRILQEELVRNGLSMQEHGRRVLMIDTAPPNIIGDDGINQLYNIADIGINTSDGEGFGLCQLEHMYTGAPQVVTDIGSYRSFLNESVAEFIPTGDRRYMPGGMPLGFYVPSFTIASVADALQRAVETLDTKKRAINTYNFKSWATVCDGFLEDVLTAARS